MQSIFGRKFGIGRADRNRTARSRRLAPSVDGLESRNLLTAAPDSGVYRPARWARDSEDETSERLG